jgi:hypothetical protein
MSEPTETANLPAAITGGFAGIPAALIPASIRALDRLIGAAVDIPVAWLEYQKVKITSQIDAFRTVDAAITQSAATKAGTDGQYADRALDHIVRKSYRQLKNKEAVSAAMLEDMRDKANDTPPDGATATQEPAPIDDDWLNVFERYAEDASTERMQKLWGRVLSGEVRAPGKYSMRTLRFLSEFSQADALGFSALCQNSFGDLAPKILVKPLDMKDIRDILYMESAGLIQGASGTGLRSKQTFDQNGRLWMREGSLAIMMNGVANTQFEYEVIALTPLGQELVTLLPGRDARAAARSVAMAIKRPEVTSAYLMLIRDDGAALPMEILWQENAEAAPVDST